MGRMAALFVLFLLPCFVLGQENSNAAFKAAAAANPTESLPACQEIPAGVPAGRPRIGLALEGGGALGLAHIGVLQWFEEHRIPVDCLAGTSMGGLVGGFYASGITPAQLRTLIAGIDWDSILNGRTEYEDLSYRRKEDQRAYPNPLIFGLRNGLTIPAGLNAGHQIGLLIDRETMPYFNLQSFDGLPIPFRCVATELVSGKPHVFDSGPLADALRSTISIPGVFSPVNDGQKVYVDGGLVNNLPTDVVRDMGADIVIGVHLETQPAEAKDVQSLFGVLQQSIRVVIAENELKGIARADAVISVPLAKYESTDYKKNEFIMQAGYDASKSKVKLLEKFALDDAHWREYLAERDARRKTVQPVPQFIQVQGTGTNKDRTENVELFLQPFKGKPLDVAKLQRSLTQLTGGGRYDTAGFRVLERNGQQGLLVLVGEKTYSPPTLQPAFEVDGSESGDVEFSLGARLTFLDVAGFRSEWRTDFLFGSTYGIQSELYKPFNAVSKWFFSPRADGSDAAFKIFSKNNPVADYRIYRADIGADIGYSFNRYSEARVGYEIGYADVALRLGQPAFTSFKGRLGSFRAHYLLDWTDDPVIPRRGVLGEVTFRLYDTSPSAANTFPAMNGRLEYFKPISKPASIFVTGEAGTTFGSKDTGIPQFFLGGPTRLSAYGSNELFGNQYYYFRAGYLHDLFTLPPFLGKKIYAIGSYEFGKMYGATNSSKFPNDFTVGLLAETSFGPIVIGESIGDTGHHKWFFSLGRVF